MTFNIEQLIRAAEFELDLPGVGHVRCLSITTDCLSAAEKEINSGVDGYEFARWLLGELARNLPEGYSAENAIDDFPKLTQEELNSVQNDTLESFSRRIIEIHGNYLLKSYEADDLARLEKEPVCDFLIRAIKHHISEERAHINRLLKPYESGVFSQMTIDSAKRNIELSSRIDELLKDSSSHFMIAPPPIKLPEIGDPPIVTINKRIDETNKQLTNLLSISQLSAQLIKNMNDTALKMQTDFMNNADVTERHTKKALFVAVIGLVISTIGLLISSVFSVLNYFDGKQAGLETKSQIQQFHNELQNIQNEQHEVREAIVKAEESKQKSKFKHTKK